MPFQKGKPRPANGGRRAGTPNKATASAREAFQLAFQTLQVKPEGKEALDLSLGAWARLNPTEFYKLYARLIPVEHTGDGGTGPVQAIVRHVYENIETSKSPAK